jgi:Holliday junction resolvase
MKESLVQKNIARDLRKVGWEPIRINGGTAKHGRGEVRYVANYFIYGLKSSAGFADLMALRDGKVIFVEVKKDEKGRMSKDQKVFKEYVERLGFLHFLAYSSADLFEQMKAVGVL